MNGCSQAPDFSAPGVYVDIREEPKVRLLAVAPDGVKTELLDLWVQDHGDRAQYILHCGT